MKINLNDTVKVVLTKHGREILRQHYIDLYRPFNDSISQEAIGKRTLPSNPLCQLENIGTDQKFQLWELAQIFGNHMYNGAEPVFESNILKVE